MYSCVWLYVSKMDNSNDTEDKEGIRIILLL